MLNVVLYSPEIPQNTGAIGRLCLATGATLNLIKPLGFSIDDKSVKRAGLDYWKDVKIKVWESWLEFEDGRHEESSLYYLTTKTKKSHFEVEFKKGDYLVFGPESKGLPEHLIEAENAQNLTIPMVPGSTRSLNLATSVSIVLYEDVRQVGFN